MAATPSYSVSSNPSGFTHVSKSLKPFYSIILPKPEPVIAFQKHRICRSEIRCFEPRRSWTIEHVPKVKDSIQSNAASQHPTRNSKKVSLFYCDETKTLAQKIAAKERFYFGDHILPCFESRIPLFKIRLQVLPDSDNVSIAFPDDGSWKRFHKQLQHFPTIVCAKVREGDHRIVRIKDGDPKGRHVVVVDDLVQSGGTLIECQKVLAAHGAKKISAYMTHGIFPNKSWAHFEHDNGGHPDTAFTYFWITHSCPLTVKGVMNKLPFEILSLAGSIAASLQV